jgi:hypothetical protein
MIPVGKENGVSFDFHISFCLEFFVGDHLGKTKREQGPPITIIPTTTSLSNTPLQIKDFCKTE